MRFIVKSPSAARPSAGCASVPVSCHCTDLALVYGKGCGLSPVPTAFWAFLGAGFGRPEVGPPQFGQGLGLGLSPGCDPGVVAGNQHFRDLLALERLRAGIL